MLKPSLIAGVLLALVTSSAQAEALRAFDVAEDLSRFAYAEAPRFDDDMPAYGNAFITQGYIYPAGTLDGGVEGTLADGSPAFPDKVLGTWTCDGYFVGDGMRTKTGTFVISRQVFAFKDGDLLIAEGPEAVDNGVAVRRAITGGTGDYADHAAEMVQVMLGMTDGYGTRLQMRIADDRQAQVDAADAAAEAGWAAD
jgi:hypothetical protein